MGPPIPGRGVPRIDVSVYMTNIEAPNLILFYLQSIPLHHPKVRTGLDVDHHKVMKPAVGEGYFQAVSLTLSEFQM